MRISFVIIVLFCSGVAWAADEPAANRILRTMNFEERQLGNAEDLPMHWAKVSGPGMPHYVNGQLGTDRARSGRYSFRFDLNGGSVVYRYDAQQIKVQPRSHYRVEGYVQTTVLTHARARMTAYFVDIDKRPILSSVRHSELYAAIQADEPWKHLHVELSTDQNAQWLVIELALLQPAQYSADSLGPQSLFPQDIRGSAWFDDITVSQVPKVKLSTDRPGNIFRKGETLSLTVVVNDRSTDDLAAQLVIRDALEKVVYQRSGAMDMSAAEVLGPGRKRMRLPLPSLNPGWYEAGLVMTSRGQLVGTQTLDMVLLADNAAPARPDDRFGIIATDLPFSGWSELPDILPCLSAGRVKLAVWSKNGDVQQIDPAGFDQVLVRLQELGIRPTACLVDLPPNIVRKLKGGTWLDLLDAKSEAWQPQLAYLISRHANHLERWQLGADGSEAFVTDKPMRQVYQMVYDEFAKLVQKPDLAMPWLAWYELDGELPATVALAVHPSVLPSQLPMYIQDISKANGHNLSLSLQLLDRNRYGRELQIRDLAQRVIYAMTGNASRIDIPLPFTVSKEDGDLMKQPQELLMIVRTLTTVLGGAVYRGKVPIAEGVEAFLFDKNGQGIIAMWDRGHESGVRQLALTLGESPRAVDLWGNVTPLLRPRDNGRPSDKVQLTVGPMPFFLMDIDGQLAQLRASLAFDRPLLESSFKPHVRHIRFSNPYKTAITGSLKLRGPQGWAFSPPMLSFSANPGEVIDREVVVEFPYNSFAGPKTIMAEFQFPDNHVSSTSVPLTMNLGLSDVGMQTLAMRDGSDVLVQQIITNYGDKPIDYTAFAAVPGRPREERLVNKLAAGRTMIKGYRFPKVSGQQVKVRSGIKELLGSRILNAEVDVQ